MAQKTYLKYDAFFLIFKSYIQNYSAKHFTWLKHLWIHIIKMQITNTCKTVTYSVINLS